MNIVSHRACGCGIEHRIEQNIFKSGAPGRPEHEVYQVELQDGMTPVRDEYHALAAAMDRDGNGIISSEEILPPTDKVGHAVVDQPDFTFGFKHKLAGWSSPYADHYPSNAQYETRFDEYAESHPELVQKVALGETDEGRTLWGLRIGKAPAGEKPGVLVVGGQHAREWAGPQAVTTAIDTLLEGYGKDQELTQKLEEMELWFVPMANPDGYEYSRNADPDWRKNRSRHPGIDGVGTDLNRNYRADFRFHGDIPGRTEDDQGASDDPNHLTYRGPHAVSERESRVLTDFMDTKANLKGVLDVHGFGRMILFPGVKDPAREAQYRSAADQINKALDIPYTPLAIPELYPTTGDMNAYADRRGLFSMGLEIGTSFQPSPDKIGDIKVRGSKAVLAFIDQIAQQSATAGPDAVSEAAPSSPTAPLLAV